MSLSQNRLDKVDEYLNKLDRVTDALPGRQGLGQPDPHRAAPEQGPAGRPGSGARAGRAEPEERSRQHRGPGAQGHHPRRSGPAVAARPIKILEQLAGANRLGANERFLLAQLYLGQRDEEKYRGEMLKLLNLKVRNPRHLAHFINYWIGRNQLDQAERWLAELKKAEPQGLPALELEARLLDLRKRKPELLALLEARGREVPDQIGPVADLLNRYGFAKEAEAAYKAFIARDPKQPERALALAQFLARQDRVCRGDGRSSRKPGRPAAPNRSPWRPSRCMTLRPRMKHNEHRLKPGCRRRSKRDSRRTASNPS